MWYKSQSTVRPITPDTTSSHYYVYLRKNIEQIETEDESGNTYIMYEYDELKIPKEMYPLYAEEQKDRADIEYLAMMSDIELDDEEEEEDAEE